MDGESLDWFVGQPPRLAAARAETAKFLDIDPDLMAFVSNASAGSSTVLQSLPVPPAGAEIVVTDHGYGAVLRGVERFARRFGATVRVAHVPLAADEDQAYEAIWAEVSDRTTLILLDHLTSPTARLMPVQRICRSARERGIVTIIDAAHVPMMIPEAAQESEADFWIGNLHKYGCCPRGTAVLIARPETADLAHPLVDSWGFEHPFPVRFDYQATTDLTCWLATPTALAAMEDTLGWAEVRDYNKGLADWAQLAVADGLRSAFGPIEAALVGMPADALRLVRLPEQFAPGRAVSRDLQAVLLRAGFETAFTAFDGIGYLRLSAHAYNTPDDYQALIEEGIPLLQQVVG